MTSDPVCIDDDAAVDDVIIVGKVIGIVGRFELISVLERSLSETGKLAEAAE